MRQYTRFKAEHPDCVLFFRMGDFYEMFNEDAKLAHEVLGIALTKRTHGIPMAGVPYHAVETYLRRMIEQGYRVAVCDQVQDPSEAKGVVDRAVTRVLTPGTLVDESLLEDARSNHLVALQILGSGRQATALLAVAELSTGAFTLFDLSPGRVLDELVRIAPSELLYPEPADGVVPASIEAIRQATDCALSERPAWTFRVADAHEGLCRHFGVATLSGFGLDDQDPALGVAGALLRYLQETQAPQQPGNHMLGHLRPPRREAPDRYLAIDGASLRNLEIERTMRTGQTAGSLLSILQHCRTAMGKRLLRQWLCFPLRDIDAIESRQGAVATFIEDATLAGQLTGHLSGVQDVARIVGRVAVRRATPRDVVALGKSVSRLGEVVRLLADLSALARHHGRLQSLQETLGPLAETITRQCVDTPPAHLREGGLFRAGVDEVLDECHDLQRDARTWLAGYRDRLIGATGIKSLKVDQNKVFGYYIEVTHMHAGKVPASFSRKQTLKNAERYITPELKEFEDKITTAESRAIEREKLLYERLCEQVADQLAALAEYAEIIAELDVLVCFADIAQRYRYARPQLVEAPIIDIRAGRHPVLDRMLADRFVPNDCVMGSDEAPRPGGPPEQGGHGRPKRRSDEGEEEDASRRTPHASSLCLITGPNMAGKSTYIRQTALIVLLAHTGSYVPAESATIGLADRIFTRIGASDELHAGQSTFMVEMTETGNILHHATDRSVVILDEIGRGTSTLDGLSLAWAIAECLAARRCRTLFATHYHELTALADRIDNVTNLHVSVREWGEQVIFLYRILPGRTDRSYGIHVAKIAGVPPEVVSRAAELLETLAVHTEPPAVPDPVAARDRQMNLFTEYLEHPVVEALRKLNPETMTPLEAFDVLRRLSAETSKT